MSRNKMCRDKVLGALYGAAYGDSLGAVTEFCTRKEIVQAFPAGCRDYAASISRITRGIMPGTVTDDFGSSCYFMRAILRHGGRFDRDIAVEAVLDWSQDEIVFAKYAGQNTKAAMERVKQGIIIDENSRQQHFSRQNTNGGAMKASPAGLLACGDPKLAIQYALDLCWPTHYNSAAASGACAIACAVCEAQREDAALDSIFEKAIEGAELSRRQLEAEGVEAFGPYVSRRIEMAVELGRKAQGSEIYDLLNGVIGTGISVQESVPAVFAIIAANKGEFLSSVWCAVNAGGDTDTTASMTGALLGGYCGIDAVPQAAITRINEANHFLALRETVTEYADLIEKECDKI